MLVDDDAPVRDALKRALVEANFRVICAVNCRDALRQVQQNSIDIVVLGLGRDVGNDWETFRRLSQYQPRLRFVVAGASSEGFVHLLAPTADALIEKPIDLPLLFATLGRLSMTPFETLERHLLAAATTDVGSQREIIRQDREKFNQNQWQEEHWFRLRLFAGYLSVFLLLSILGGGGYIILNPAKFTDTVVSRAAAGAILVDVLGLLVTVWKGLALKTEKGRVLKRATARRPDL